MIKCIKISFFVLVLQSSNLLEACDTKLSPYLVINDSESSYVIIQSLKTKKYFLVFDEPSKAVLEIEITKYFEKKNKLFVLVKKVHVANYKKMPFKSSKEIEGEIISISGSADTVFRIMNPGLEISPKNKSYTAISSDFKEAYRWTKKSKGFIIDEQKSWGILMRKDKTLNELNLDELFKKPYIVGNRYFYLRKDKLSADAVWEDGFFERGVYVDGKTGSIEIVHSYKEIITIVKPDKPSEINIQQVK